MQAHWLKGLVVVVKILYIGFFILRLFANHKFYIAVKLPVKSRTLFISYVNAFGTRQTEYFFFVSFSLSLIIILTMASSINLTTNNYI